MNPAETAAAATAPVEIIGWPTRFVGGDGSTRRVFAEPRGPASTVRSVLKGLSARFPQLDAALWHGDGLGEHIEVLVNDAVLGIGHTLDSPLKPGDRLTLLAQFMGGSEPRAPGVQHLAGRPGVTEPRAPRVQHLAGGPGVTEPRAPRSGHPRLEPGTRHSLQP